MIIRIISWRITDIMAKKILTWNVHIIPCVMGFEMLHSLGECRWTQGTLPHKRVLFFLGCYHGNPSRKLVVGRGLSLSYISPFDLHSHSWHSFIKAAENTAITSAGSLWSCFHFACTRSPLVCQLLVVVSDESRETAKEQIRQEEKSASISFSQTAFFMLNLYVQKGRQPASEQSQRDN